MSIYADENIDYSLQMHSWTHLVKRWEYCLYMERSLLLYKWRSIQHHDLYNLNPRRWRSRLERSPLACGGLGIRVPAASDLSRKKGSDCSTAKRSAIGVSVTGPRIVCFGFYCSIAMSAEHRSNFAALHQQWWYLHMKDFRVGRKDAKKTQTKNIT